MQAQPGHRRVEQGATQPQRRAEEAGRSAGERAQHALRPRHLPAQRQRAEAGEQGGVGPGVILDRVAAPHDLAHQGGVRLRARADEEEADPRPVPVEQVEHSGRHRRVGAVVEGEGDPAAPGRFGGQAHQGGAEQGRTRPHGQAQHEVVARHGTEQPGPRPGGGEQRRRRRGVQQQGRADQHRGPPPARPAAWPGVPLAGVTPNGHAGGGQAGGGRAAFERGRVGCARIEGHRIGCTRAGCHRVGCGRVRDGRGRRGPGRRHGRPRRWRRGGSRGRRGGGRHVRPGT